jgi:hypothetical protein
MFFKKLKSLNVLLLNVALLLIAFHGNDLRAQTNDGFSTSKALFKSRLSAEDFVFNRLTKSSGGELSLSDRFLVALNSNNGDDPVSVKQQLEITIEYAAHVVDALRAYDYTERSMGRAIAEAQTIHGNELSLEAVNAYAQLSGKLGDNEDFDMGAEAIATRWTSGMMLNTREALTRLEDYSDVFEKALSAGVVLNSAEADQCIGSGCDEVQKLAYNKALENYPKEVGELLNNKPSLVPDARARDDSGCTSFFCHMYTLRRETETDTSSFDGEPNLSPGRLAFDIVDKALAVDQEVRVDRWQLQAEQRHLLTEQQKTERQTAVRCLGWDSASPPNCIGGWM